MYRHSHPFLGPSISDEQKIQRYSIGLFGQLLFAKDEEETREKVLKIFPVSPPGDASLALTGFKHRSCSGFPIGSQ